MAKSKSFLDKGKLAAINKSIKNRQEKSILLKAKLSNLYKTLPTNQLQIQAINQLQAEFMTKQRELAEEYMQKEINIIEDLGGKYRVLCVECGKLIIGNWYGNAGSEYCQECWMKKEQLTNK